MIEVTPELYKEYYDRMQSIVQSMQANDHRLTRSQMDELEEIFQVLHTMYPDKFERVKFVPAVDKDNKPCKDEYVPVDLNSGKRLDS